MKFTTIFKIPNTSQMLIIPFLSMHYSGTAYSSRTSKLLLLPLTHVYMNGPITKFEFGEKHTFMFPTFEFMRQLSIITVPVSINCA
jgi:hypothetical protein